MLNHPVNGLTNASKWRHQDMMIEAEHERRVALCLTTVRQAIWSALLISLRLEWRQHDVRYAAYRSPARVGR
ncbi:MAG: hypothetical protein U0Z70_01325 [Thermomicrobiales bacterium]